MEKYMQILARLQPGQSIARVTEGFQLKEGKAALSIVFPRVESLLMWFDREYPAKQAGAVEAPETGFFPYSLTCSCGCTLEGSTEEKGAAVYCECGQGVGLNIRQDEPEPILNKYGHDLRKYLSSGWEDVNEWCEYIAIDQDGELYEYQARPYPEEEKWGISPDLSCDYSLTVPIAGIN